MTLLAPDRAQDEHDLEEDETRSQPRRISRRKLLSGLVIALGTTGPAALPPHAAAMETRPCPPCLVMVDSVCPINCPGVGPCVCQPICEGFKPDGASCDDGLYCNGSDRCQGGTCSLQAIRARGPTATRTAASSCRETDDTCTGPDPDGSLCRPGSGDDCDPDEECKAGSCPGDRVWPAGRVCNRGSGGRCDRDEVCSGVARAACPADVVAAASTVCRASAGACDVAERCPGTVDGACPPDGFVSATTECRASTAECDRAEQCTGDAPDRPADVSAASGTPCSEDDDLCTLDVCDGAGACAHVASADSHDIDADTPLEAIVVLGNQADAAAGLCGESSFESADCTLNGAGSAIVCKR